MARLAPDPAAGRAETFEHGSDVGIRGVGPTLEAAFVQAALALTSVVTEVAQVRPRESIEIDRDAPDDEVLFFDWINALVYEMAVQRMLFSRFELSIEDGRLHARAHGERIDPPRHKPAVEVKGATWTELAVRRHPDGTWTAQCVVDV